MSHQSVNIIKHDRRSEAFNRDKLFASVKAACLSEHTPSGQAENIADKVCDSVIAWLENRPEVTSKDLRKVAARHLHPYHPDAAYIYDQHRTTI